MQQSPNTSDCSCMVLISIQICSVEGFNDMLLKSYLQLVSLRDLQFYGDFRNVSTSSDGFLSIAFQRSHQRASN
jgi:hypothetical protein